MNDVDISEEEHEENENENSQLREVYIFPRKKHIDGILKHNLHKLTNSRVPAPYSFPYMTPNVEPPTSFS